MLGRPLSLYDSCEKVLRVGEQPVHFTCYSKGAQREVKCIEFSKHWFDTEIQAQYSQKEGTKPS